MAANYDNNDSIAPPGSADNTTSLFGSGSPDQPAADNALPKPAPVNSENTAEAEKKLQGSIGRIDFIPDGDLVIVLTKFKDENLKPFVLNLLHKSAPAGSEKPGNVPSEIHARVQSSILRLTGKGFEVILRPDGKKEVLPDGTRVYRDDDDCAEALLMICCIIFWKSWLRPKDLSFAQLSDVCVVIDKYMLRSTLEMATELWMQAFLPLLASRSFKSTSAMEQGFCISSVLRSRSMFNHVAEYALMQTPDYKILMQGKPFSEKLLGLINSARNTVREEFHNQLAPIIETYLENTGEPVCDRQKYDCDGMALGTLLMALRETGTFMAHGTLPHSQLRADKSVSNALIQLKQVRKKVATLCAGRDSRAAKEGFEIHGKLAVAVSNIMKTIDLARDSVFKAW